LNFCLLYSWQGKEKIKKIPFSYVTKELKGWRSNAVALRRADGFALPTQTINAAWICNWLKIYSAASLLQNRLLCVVVGAN